MITQIEIDGFKTFKDFKVELAPFQVIVGPNGSGKSNLFDALQLLSQLARKDLFEFYKPLRGKANGLFSRYPNGKQSESIRLAVEMLLDKKVVDDFGNVATLDYTRLRYELDIVKKEEGDLSHFSVNKESLFSIPEEEDSWSKKYGLSSRNGWLPEAKLKKIFIETRPNSNIVFDKQPISGINIVSDSSSGPFIYLHQDRLVTQPFIINARLTKQTGLNFSLGGINLPHVLAACNELKSLQFFHFNPTVLRHPSDLEASRFLATDGSNLPTTLLRMQAEDKYILKDVSRDLANFVSGIRDVIVRSIKSRGECEVYIRTNTGTTLPSEVLSDGTLRVLALSTLRNDPRLHGTICLEEPENGVHPHCLEKIALMLSEMVTDFRDPVQRDEPLRQVLATTHSPLFISQPTVINALLFAYPSTQRTRGAVEVQVTEMVPVLTNPSEEILLFEKKEDRRFGIYTLNMIKKYLVDNQMEQAIEEIEHAKKTLSEGIEW